jgi:hypothetical protein
LVSLRAPSVFTHHLLDDFPNLSVLSCCQAVDEFFVRLGGG